MKFSQLFISGILMLASPAVCAQPKQKIILFPECDTLKDSRHEWILNTELKSTDDQITGWLTKHASGKKLNAGAEFHFILNNKKGVCCKRVIVFDSTQTHVPDLVLLIQKLTNYPEFKQLAQNSSKTKMLQGVVYFDEVKRGYRIGLMPAFPGK